MLLIAHVCRVLYYCILVRRMLLLGFLGSGFHGVLCGYQVLGGYSFLLLGLSCRDLLWFSILSNGVCLLGIFGSRIWVLASAFYLGVYVGF